MALSLNGTSGISGVDGSAGTPALQGSDTNTGISFGADTVNINTGGTTRATVDSSGRVLVGTSTARTNFFNGTAGTRLQIENAGAGVAEASFVRDENNTNGGLIILGKSRGTTAGANTVVQSGDEIGTVDFQAADGTDFVIGARITAAIDGTPGPDDMPSRLVFSTTADGASSPTERMRIKSDGAVSLASSVTDTAVSIVSIQGGSNGRVLINNYSQSGNEGWNGSNTVLFIGKQGATNRSINTAGTINASGADYAEYMVKAGDFNIAKGAVCGVTADGLLTIDYGDAVSFVVKSTNPSYVGGDTWGTEDAIGVKPDADDVEALTQWEADLEAARQTVDRIAFAGQVPVNVLGATPGQYIVPMKSADGGIEGIAKNEADLTLAEYMRAVGKVIAIEDDGRARIIVKVA